MTKHPPFPPEKKVSLPFNRFKMVNVIIKHVMREREGEPGGKGGMRKKLFQVVK